MTDNAWAYTHNRSLRLLLRSRQMTHIRTRPYTPRTNGKAERFIRTLLGGWAYGAIYRSSTERTNAPTGWLDRLIGVSDTSSARARLPVPCQGATRSP